MSSHSVSHVKDADGLCSAALALAARGGTFALTDYDDIIEELGRIPADVTDLVLSDLGTDPSRFAAFRDALAGLAGRMKVTYIDHHYLTDAMKREVQGLGVLVVHDVAECASMLTYQTFKGSLPAEASYLAMFGAVTDYMDSSPLASRMMERFDRQFVLLESSLLSYAIANQGRDIKYLRELVQELSRMKMPHDIEGVTAHAMDQAEMMRMLRSEVRGKGKVIGKLAYTETEQTSTGNVAKLLLGAFDVQLGVSFRKKSGGRVEMSLRCISECRVHLGQTISEIAMRHGGNGGGHARAAGCSLPESAVEEALRELASRL